MKCAVHQDVDATAYCRNCGKALCPECARPVRDVIYCEDCLAATLGLPGAPLLSGAAVPAGTAAVPPYVPPPSSYASSAVAGAPHTRNGSVAFLLGLVPGLGAVYNGEYNKALIHIVVFAAIIVGLSSDIGESETTALAFLLAGFVFYMAFDARRTALARSAGQAQIDPLEHWSRERPVGPIILIGLGALFLLNNFSWFAFYRVKQLWPLVLIGVGLLMFRNRMGKEL
jgi:hypothetical protein